MRALTGREMEEVERQAVESQHVSLSELMERAGAAVARVAASMAPRGRIVIVSGRGNNGGDGIVAARLLAERGRKVHLFVLAQPAKLAAEAKEAFGRLDRSLAALSPRPPVAFDSPEILPQLSEGLPDASLVVDCLFGFNLKGAPEGRYAEVIDAINDAGRRVLSVDVPSGVEASTGRVNGPAIRATKTLTFTAPKIGLVVTPGMEYAGAVEVAEIGIDAALVAAAGSVEVTESGWVREMLPRRVLDAHKKAVGRVLVVAGSVGMTGAAAMTSEGALRSGAGIVTLGVPESLNDILEAKLTEIMTLPLPETPARSLLDASADRVLQSCSSFDALVLGPGLSTDESTVRLVQSLVARAPIPLVLDADGLNAIAGRVELLEERQEPLVVTPHPGELSRLAQVAVEEIQGDRLRAARQAASEWRCVVLLKGAGTIVSDGGQSFVNPTGNPGLATAGTGDVLSGVIGSLLAEGMEPLAAAASGAYLHGLAGDYAARSLTARCMTATDVISFLPSAFRHVEKAPLSRKVR